MTTATEQGAAWLEARGLDLELAVKMGWEAGTGKDGKVWMKIPFVRDGKVATMQYRRLDAKEFRFAKGSEIDLWNVDVLKDETLFGVSLIMAEGACDGLALMQCGFQRTVAVPGWSDKNFEPDKYDPFKRNEAAIKGPGTIIVAQHADNAGAAMLRGTANFFSENDVRYVTWPKGCKDANDTLLLHGAEAVVVAVNGARPLDPPGGMITGFSDLPPRPERKLWGIDYPGLDTFIKLRSREISLLTGCPSAGKTTFAVWVAHHLVRANDIRIAFASFESDPVEVRQHLLKLNGYSGDLYDKDKYERIIASLDRNYRIVHRVDEPGQDHGMKWLKAMIHKLAARDGCNVVIVDPWNEIEHYLEPGESMTNYANVALTEVRRWAERYDIHIMIVAHPKKMEGKRVPGGYDIADSAAFANKPGMGWTIHLEKDDKHGDHVSLTTWKVRNRQETGCRPGTRLLTFDETSMIYRPMGGN